MWIWHTYGGLKLNEGWSRNLNTENLMFCPRTKLRGLAVYEDDSLKDDKPGAGTVLRASYKFYFESAHELRRRRRENLRLKTS